MQPRAQQTNALTDIRQQQRKSSSSPFPFHLLIYESVFSSKKQTSRRPSLNVHQQGSAAGLGCWENGRRISGCLHRLSPAGHPTLNSFYYFSSSSSEEDNLYNISLEFLDSTQLGSIRLRSI
jgi:hypothetical protein